MVDRARLGELADECRKLSPALRRLEREHAQELARVEAAELAEFRELAREAYVAFRGDEDMAVETMGRWCKKVQKLRTPSHETGNYASEAALRAVCSAFAELRESVPNAAFIIVRLDAT